METSPDLYVGIMSGTSLDGVDAALVDFSQAAPRLVCSHFQPYPQQLKETLLALHQPAHNEIHLAQLSANQLAQEYAAANRDSMLDLVLAALRRHLPAFQITDEVVNCHHNYVAMEHHFNANVWVTRKGAIRARDGDLGIIPGSMGARSYIVRGKGNPDSFCSCAHGAGRRMSRTQAEKQFSEADLARQTAGVICRKDKGVLDEIPGAYKDIDTVMANQSDLIEVVHTLKQVLCVKG